MGGRRDRVGEFNVLERGRGVQWAGEKRDGTGQL